MFCCLVFWKIYFCAYVKCEKHAFRQKIWFPVPSLSVERLTLHQYFHYASVSINSGSQVVPPTLESSKSMTYLQNLKTFLLECSYLKYLYQMILQVLFGYGKVLILSAMT